MSANLVHKAFRLDGKTFTNDSLLIKATRLVNEGSDFEAEIGRFLIDWLDDEPNIKVKTSGSTGKPKTMSLTKKAMKFSALATGLFFNLKPSQSALLCLPVSYIAGKMMLVRALVLGLEIDTVIPKINLYINEKSYDFVAMIPSQVEKNINLLNQFEILIIGGGAVSHQLKLQLQDKETSVFETYGMTETITHIAIKPLNKIDNETYFSVLPEITISQDHRKCLLINAPKLSKDIITTNDVVRLYSNTEFEWLGRVDNVINSGGLKLFPEKIEAKLSPYISERFFIASQKDKTYGEVIILVVESKINTISNSIFKDLNKSEIPKAVYTISNFVETASKKIQRRKTLDLIYSSK